jgi:hypothetical protein
LQKSDTFKSHIVVYCSFRMLYTIVLTLHSHHTETATDGGLVMFTISHSMVFLLILTQNWSNHIKVISRRHAHTLTHRQIICVTIQTNFSLRSQQKPCLHLPCECSFYTWMYSYTYRYTRWFKYDRDKLWLVYTQIVPVISEPTCMYNDMLKTLPAQLYNITSLIYSNNWEMHSKSCIKNTDFQWYSLQHSSMDYVDQYAITMDLFTHGYRNSVLNL